MFGRKPKHKHVWSAWGDPVATSYSYMIQFRYCIDQNCNLVEQRTTDRRSSAW